MIRSERKATRGFHPLDSSIVQHAKKLNVELTLPSWMDRIRMGINPRRVQNWMQLGGINSLQITGNFREPFKPGPTDDGNSLVERDNPPYAVAIYKSDKLTEPPFLAARWVDASLHINMQDIYSRVSKVRDREQNYFLWGKEIDSRVRRGIADIGIQHLLFDLGTPDKVNFGLGTAIGTGLGTVLSTTNVEDQTIFDNDLSVPALLLVSNVAMHGLVNLASRLTYKVYPYDKAGFRWSLFAGPQYDRAELLSRLTKVNRVVKDMPERIDYRTLGWGH